MKTLPALNSKTLILQAWQAAIKSVSGKRVTRAAIAADGLESVTHLLAVGKAAGAMCLGALEFFAGRGLVVTKYGHGDVALAAHPRIAVIEAGHPLPDERSLRAGRAVEEFVLSVAPHERLVMLVSGGASALAERLPGGVDLAALQDLTTKLLAGGYSVDQINAARIQLSRIKGGKLLRRFGGRSVRVYAISDVPGDSIDLIGGGIGGIAQSPAPALPKEIVRLLERLGGNLPGALEPGAFEPRFNYRAKVIASNQTARAGAAEFLRERGLPIIANEESLNCDIHAAAQYIAAELIKGAPGAYIWGGESTVVLPPKPGIGGRNQSLALALAGEIRGHRKIAALVAGTDGTDGPTNAAGGLIDGDTFDAASGARNALLKADAGTHLARIAALFKPGPTGTNVMDLVIAVKRGVE